MTKVPFPTLSDNGYTAPIESEILEGVKSDINDAFGGDLDQSLTTPQGQLAQSQAAIIADRNEQFMTLLNAVDPAYSSGRWQDGIGRIYFLTRIDAQPTVVQATVSGLTGTIIPIGAQAEAQDGNTYFSIQSVTIPIGGEVSCMFSCSTKGPIACPPGQLDTIKKAIPGWDSITNENAGTIGRDVESPADFEYRRQNSVAVNSVGFLTSILAEVLAVEGVIDAYPMQNNESVTSGAIFTGAISGTTLTVSGIESGTIKIGHTVVGAEQGTVITDLGSGTGGTGTYVVNVSQTLSSVGLYSAVGGVPMLPNSIYIAVHGGVSQEIGEAIYRKKTPCAMNGDTTVIVQDTYTGYSPPLPEYEITFNRPDVVPVLFSVSMQTSSAIPPDASDQIRNAITSVFNGSDGGQRARIGSYIFASRFYAAVASLGPWALIYSILIGVSTANQTSLLMRIDQVPTIGEIEVTFG